MKVFYFGCLGDKGHFLHNPGGRRDYSQQPSIPWTSYDGTLCPGYIRPYENGPEIEGEAALHHKGGWTALAFWDRSVDPRGACNSVFFAEGSHTGAAMLEIAGQYFPEVMSRFTFTVRIVSRPDDVITVKTPCSVCGRIGFGAKLDTWEHDPPGWFRFVGHVGRPGEQAATPTRFACSVKCASTIPQPTAAT